MTAGDLEGLVEYLTNVSRMWAHPEATHEEPKAFVLEVLEEADLGENRILRIRPRADYRELFRAGAYRKSVTYGRGERTRTDARSQWPTIHIDLGNVPE